MESPERVTVKAKWNEDLRRLTIPHSASFQTFHTLLCKLFQAEIESIKYFDDEEDEVRITTDEELEEAIRLISNQKQALLRVQITGKASTVPLIPPSFIAPTTEKAPSILKLSNSGIPDVLIVSDSNGNTKVSLVNEQISVSLPQTTEHPKHDTNPSTTVVSLIDGSMSIAQIARKTASDVLDLATSTYSRTSAVADDAAKLGNKEIADMCSSTMELSKASAARVCELSRSIADATNKAAVSASLLGDELRKATMESMSELSNQARDKTNEVAAATSARIDEVLRQFKQQHTS